MLARPINALQPPAGQRLEVQRLAPLRALLTEAKGLPLTTSQIDAILDDKLDEDVERIELVHTHGQQLNIDDALFRLKNELLDKETFLNMTPIAGESAVFRMTDEQKCVYYTLGATVDHERICMQVERKSSTCVSIRIQVDPSPIWMYVGGVSVEERTVDKLFLDTEQGTWRENLTKLARLWPCTRGLRVRRDDDGLHVVLPPALVEGMLSGLVSAAGVDALWSSYRNDTIPHHPWTADGDVMLKIQNPGQAGHFGALSIKVPIHPLSAHVSGGRLEMFLSACGCTVKMQPSILLCGRCTPWHGQNDQRTAFFERCQRAGNRCLDRIHLTIGCSAGGKWAEKRSLKLSARTDEGVTPLVKAMANAVEFANRVAEDPSTVKLIEYVTALPNAPPIPNTPLVNEATKLLRTKLHQWKGRGKTRKLVDREGKGPKKTIEKRFGWLFPTHAAS